MITSGQGVQEALSRFPTEIVGYDVSDAMHRQRDSDDYE